MSYENEMNQLKERLTMYPHVYNKKLSLHEWEELDKPYNWSIVEQKENVVLFVDNAYGLLAIFVNGQLHDVGESYVISNDGEYVGLSEAYLSNKCKLFKAM